MLDEEKIRQLLHDDAASVRAPADLWETVRQELQAPSPRFHQAWLSRLSGRWLVTVTAAVVSAWGVFMVPQVAHGALRPAFERFGFDPMAPTAVWSAVPK